MPSLPLLAPKLSGNQAEKFVVIVNKEHTEEDWESHRHLIEHLYIRENRRLVDTMAIMAAKHGFGATEQIYKKRLKKWNIRKRSYRKNSASPTTSTPPTNDEDDGDDAAAAAAAAASTAAAASSPAPAPAAPAAVAVASPAARATDLDAADEAEDDCDAAAQDPGTSMVVAPGMMRLAPYTGLELVLDNVRCWSLCKLETTDVVADPMVEYLANPGQPPIQDSRTMYRTFELVFDLWHYGRGQLAGMAARRAFFILEFVLMEDHPDLIWHILDTIYDMVDRGHIQLLGMFLRHAGVLATARLAREHPLVAILQELIKCDYQTPQGRQYVCHLLRSAWLRNVDILSDQVGSLAPKHLWLYEQLIWDGRTGLRKGCQLARKRETMTAALSNMHRVLQHQERRRRRRRRQQQDKEEEEEEEEQGVGDSTSAVSGVDQLRTMALMLEYTQMDLVNRDEAEHLALDLLQRTRRGANESRSDARFHAYACKMLARLQEHRQDWAHAEDNLKQAVEKREAAHGTGSDLRVIRDMWVLAGHYRRVGRDAAADQVVQEAVSRAETLLKGVEEAAVLHSMGRSRMPFFG
ncbi:hypothetical protein E4U43_001121 [Claviceps pusilla]|uniref:Clr5 domain-containing protein n=1 Tax=Claviceps pusilla TaxID=123648 RepID=A0A9P7N892_9HYPO|nr:hypothetical protein E4U43_001121 [Claviceps pusilla]